MHYKALAVVEISVETEPETFARQVYGETIELMAPYNEATEERRYLEFDDRTESLKVEFAEKVDCVRLADGWIREINDWWFAKAYTIRNGKVYQREAGPLRHEKRTKKAKRMTVLPDYPRARLHKSFQDYAENYRGCTYDVERNAYGYYYNPNSRWDWYQLGGRWPDMFLVKDTCTEYFDGEYSCYIRESKLETPEGFRWVAAARKKDIEWQAMRNWKNQKVTERFYSLEKMFCAGELAEDFYGTLTDEGIMKQGELVYRKGESVEAYLQRMSIPKSRKYPFAVGDIVDESHWFGMEDFSWNMEAAGESETKKWWTFLDEYVDGITDEMVLVGVDYHM